jgi:uncharacterized protein Veg
MVKTIPEKIKSYVGKRVTIVLSKGTVRRGKVQKTFDDHFNFTYTKGPGPGFYYDKTVSVRYNQVTKINPPKRSKTK